MFKKCILQIKKFLSKLKNKFVIKISIFKHGVFVNIKTKKLKENVEFILHNLPKKLVKGIEIIEEVFSIDSGPHQIVVKSTMNAMDIKREIGKYVYREKRWDKQEEVTRKLLASEEIDLNMFYEVYETDNYLEVFEIINSDVFAVYYGNETMTISEVAIAINSLYIKRFADENFSKQNKIESFIDELFEN